MGFSITSSAECSKCGQMLASSDEDCSACPNAWIHETVFGHVSDDVEVRFEVSTAASLSWLFEQASERLPDGHDPVGLVWLGNAESVDRMRSMDTEPPVRAHSTEVSVFEEDGD